MAYLDHACVSPPTSSALRAVQVRARELTEVDERGGTPLALDWLAERVKARRDAARLLSTDADDISVVESTTHGLGIVAAGLPLSPGDNVVVGDCDFVGIPTVWRGRRREGVEIRAAASVDGHLTADAIREAADASTRVIAVSAVQEVSGRPVAVEALAQIASDAGALLVLDGVQEAGVIARSPARDGVHAYASGGHKWLRNPFGAGFLWTSSALRDRLNPAYQGYFALEEPAGGWERRLNDPSVVSLDDAPLRTDGSSLELGGTPGWLGSVGLSAALRDLFAAGIEAVELRALQLADEVRRGLLRLGVQPFTPCGSRSAIVSFDLEPRVDNTCFVATARKHGVHVSARGGAGVSVVRASCHGHNTPDDVAALLDLVAHHVGRNR